LNISQLIGDKPVTKKAPWDLYDLNEEIPYFFPKIPPELDYINLFIFGDWHVEANTSDWILLSYIVELLKEPHNYLINPGDTFEIPFDDDVGTLMEQRVTTSQAYRVTKHILAPVADKILLMIEGNHPRRARKRAGIDITGILCEDLGINYSRGKAATTIHIGKKSKNGKPAAYTFGVNHGRGGGRTDGAKAQARFWESVTWENVDAVLIGHIHTPGYESRARVKPDPQNKSVKAKEYIQISAPSAMKFAEYAQTGGYSPPTFRIPILKLNGKEKKIDIEFPDFNSGIRDFYQKNKKFFK